MYFADHYSKNFRKGYSILGYLIGRAVDLDYAADGESHLAFLLH
jgi:hypothetical protein